MVIANDSENEPIVSRLFATLTIFATAVMASAFLWLLLLALLPDSLDATYFLAIPLIGLSGLIGAVFFLVPLFGLRRAGAVRDKRLRLASALCGLLSLMVVVAKGLWLFSP